MLLARIHGCDLLLSLGLVIVAFGCSAAPSGPGGFGAAVAAQIDTVLQSGEGLIIFDADGTLWADDVGEAFLLWQLDEGILLPDQERRIRKVWSDYTAGRLSELETWTQVALSQEGLLEDDVRSMARLFFRERFQRKIFPPMKSLVRTLQARGIDVWVVSASHRWIVEAGAEELGIPGEHVIAVSALVEQGRITGVPVEPVPYGEGKAAAIRATIGRDPKLVFGNSTGDVAMLALATSGAIVINPNDALRELSLARGWFVQAMHVATE